MQAEDFFTGPGGLLKGAILRPKRDFCTPLVIPCIFGVRVWNRNGLSIRWLKFSRSSDDTLIRTHGPNLAPGSLAGREEMRR